MMGILVTLIGAAAIAGIVWWFWLSAPKAARVAASQPIDILVQDDVYQPAVIEVPAGQPLILRFLRHDAAPCAEKVVFGELGIGADLPLHKPQTVALPALQPGSYEFTCQMGMYRGRLIAT